MNFFFSSEGLLAKRLTGNLEGQVICDRGFLPLAFDKSMSSCKAADATLVQPGYFISPLPSISGERDHCFKVISRAKLVLVCGYIHVCIIKEIYVIGSSSLMFTYIIVNRHQFGTFFIFIFYLFIKAACPITKLY